MRMFRLDVTTLLAGLLAGILPACLLVVLSYLYLAGLKPEVLSSLQEPHLERGKRRVALLADTVERRRRALVAAVQRAIVGDDLEISDEVRSDDFPHITAVRWYLEHLDDATYTQRRRSHWPDAYDAGDRGARLVRQLASAETEEERATIRRQLAALPPTAVDELGFSFASLVEYTGGPIEEALGRQLLLWPDALPPEEIAWRLAQRDYRLTLSALPTPIDVRSTESPFLPSTIDLDPEDPEQVWLAFRNGPSGGILAVQLEAEGFLDLSLTELEERFPTPEGVVFRVERVESGQDPDRLWGRWPLNAPFDHDWELWAGPSGESDPLLVTILQRLGTIHYLYGGLSILALLTVGSFLLTGLLSRRVRDSRQKDDFVRLVSHELRTPIAAIRMIAETLRLGRVRSDDERQEFLGQLEDESRRLADLIERVLEYGKKSGEREVVTDPEELVQTAV
ncbi:MAG: histidine kinase dimerization/phospho-acceptor domain-containing protein, partial [Planctomycetota bacterium]